MPVTANFVCDGCGKDSGHRPMFQRHFESFDGKGYGFGVWKHDRVEDMGPEDWQVFDPYTGACYCPECWADIESHEETA